MITYYVAAARNDAFSKAYVAGVSHGDLKSVAKDIHTCGQAGDYPIARENGELRSLTPNERAEFESVQYDA